MRSNPGVAPLGDAISGGSAVRMAFIVSTAVDRLNARSPATIS